MEKAVKVTILGARGSVAVCGEGFARYGGATTCIAVRSAGGKTVVLDAGTGIVDLPQVMSEGEKQVSVLLSYPYIDHMIGLPMCPLVFQEEVCVNIYGAVRQGLDVRAQFERLMSPPLWPVTPDKLPAQLRFWELTPSQMVEGVQVDVMEGCHPGGVSLMRLSVDGKRIMFMTDVTIREENRQDMLEFARDCDLLLCDGQYSMEEWQEKAEFGHNTWEQAVNFGVECGAKQIRIIHHDPSRTDGQLDQAGMALARIHPDCAFGRKGEEMTV